MNRIPFVYYLAAIMTVGLALPVLAAPRNVQLFQTPVADVNTAVNPYVDIRGLFATESIDESDDNLNVFTGGAIFGLPVGRNIELNAIGGISRLSDGDGSNTGLTDLGLAGRVRFDAGNELLFAAGGGVTLPVGDEGIGAGDFTVVEGFGAVHYNASSTVRMVGSASIESWSGNGNTDTVLILAPGVVLEAGSNAVIILEANFPLDDAFAGGRILSGGVDFLMAGGNLRGALGIGLHDHAPDFELQGGYVVSFD